MTSLSEKTKKEEEDAKIAAAIRCSKIGQTLASITRRYIIDPLGDIPAADAFRVEALHVVHARIIHIMEVTVDFFIQAIGAEDIAFAPRPCKQHHHIL